MSYFLWIEDFENSPEITTSEIFGSILDKSKFVENKKELKTNLKPQGIFIELSFQDGLKFIRENLEKVDYIILDIDLLAYSKGDKINADVLKLLSTFQDYQQIEDESEDEALRAKKCNELKAIAGFYLYTELVVEQGFPKQHILFCSNHGENTKTIQTAFKMAKIELPTIYKKSDKEVQEWVKHRHENPYSCLRRGIIEGCQNISKNLSKDKLSFNNFINESKKQVKLEDMRDYLGVLENFLPLREPNSTDKAVLYKLFIRTLTHEWETTEPKEINGLAWIMKNTRNWITHNSILFNSVDEQMVGYLFMLNMRIMFNFNQAKQPHEAIIFNLFSGEDLTQEVFEEQNKNKLITLKIKKVYCDLQNKVSSDKNIHDAFRFYALANNVQNSNSELKNNQALFSKLLYQMFWLINAYPRVEVRMGKVDITFEEFDYRNKAPYLFELARHIYNRSFL
jgi:hypothetical protein